MLHVSIPYTFLVYFNLKHCFWVVFFSPRSDEPLMLPLLKAGFDKVGLGSFLFHKQESSFHEDSTFLVQKIMKNIAPLE